MAASSLLFLPATLPPTPAALRTLLTRESPVKAFTVTPKNSSTCLSPYPTMTQPSTPSNSHISAPLLACCFCLRTKGSRRQESVFHTPRRSPPPQLMRRFPCGSILLYLSFLFPLATLHIGSMGGPSSQRPRNIPWVDSMSSDLPRFTHIAIS